MIPQTTNKNGTPVIYELIRANHNNLCYPCSIKPIFLTFFLMIAIITPAQTIARIEITGNKSFSKNNYLSWIKISAGMKSFDGIEDSVKSRIMSALRENGYLNASFNKIELQQVDTARSSLHITVEEGNPTLVNKINIINSLKDSLHVMNMLHNLEGTPLANFNLDFTFSRILDYYENSGFPFASVKIESILFSNDSTRESPRADIMLRIEKGTKSNIDKIEVAGNNKTKDFVVMRALRINKGEEYSQEKIDRIPGQLNRLRFFDPVELPSFYFNSKKEGVLKISVKEKQTNFFDGIIGYVPAANDKQSGYFTGFINVNLRNLFGTGRAASVRWQQESRSSQELELQYMEPWLLDYPFNIEGRLFQRKQDSTYIQRNLEGRIEYLATDEISASAIINTQSTIPSESSSKLFTVYNSSSFTSGINLKIDTRNDFYAPTEGIYFNNTYKYTIKKINGPAALITPGTKTDITLQRLEFDFNFFQRIMTRQVAAIGVHARELRGDDVEFSDLYFLGGTNSLRGYREKQFQGNRILWSNLEYRLLLSNRSFAFVFFDSGYFLRKEDQQRNIPEVSEFKIGYGFGLNLETGLGVLSVSFALAKGDSFGDGKIHFGIINEF
ncbi:MAG: hypothetical protein CVV24_11600 [Ignavibacteriae bacterium HGW-Ignavibacteriae-3]|nr:MAG: hypothetical protein CVV24_11600 [Ignavibacteriae bacterium HGW-Ignavibacteriae-3]